MLLPFNEWLCEKMLGHPYLHVMLVDPDDPNSLFFCRCGNCNAWFITDKKGLSKILKTHSPKRLDE